MPALPYVIASGDAVGGEDGSLGILEYGRTLWRHKGVFVLIVLLAVFLAAGISYFQPRVYQSVASVQIQGLNDNFLNLKDIDPTAAPTNSMSTESYVATQVEILKEDSLIERVVKQLKLDQHPEFTRNTGFSEKLAQLMHWQTASASQPLQQALKVSKENLKIVPPRQGQIIRIMYDAEDPRLAADFANGLVQVFIDQNVESRWHAAQQIKEWLRPQLDELRAKLEKSQNQLQAYANAAGLTITDGQENVATERLRLIQAELARAQAERMAKEPLYALSQSGQTEGISDNAAVREYQLRLTELRRQLADLESLLKPENYKVVRLKAQVAELEAASQRATANVHKRVENEYEAAQKREALLTKAYSRQAALVSDLQAKMMNYNTLKHDADTTRQVYDAMLQKVNEAGVASAIRPSNIRLVSPAHPASQPYKPNVPLNLGIGLFAGLVLGVGCVMLLEQTNRRLCVPGDAAVSPLLTELGAIPTGQRLQSFAARLLGSGDKDLSIERVTWEHKDSDMSESFRAVLASILLPARNGDAPRVLVITSPQPGEGKTTVASNLAIALAEIKHRVLLIDGDLRRPRLHKVFDVANSWGLSDLLCEKDAAVELPIEQLVKKTSVPNLCLLPSGPGPDGIFNYLYSPRMLRLFSRFREEFDHVLVDAPPCLEYADARILARNADGVILVFRANKTDKKTALAVVDQLMRDRIPIAGTILNDWDPKSGGTYGDYTYPRAYRRHGDNHSLLAFGA